MFLLDPFIYLPKIQTQNTKEQINLCVFKLFCSVSQSNRYKVQIFKSIDFKSKLSALLM